MAAEVPYRRSDSWGMGRPHPVDLLVGARIRDLRKARGMSQGALGDQIGVTFQQIQKYERGANRVSASALYEIAGVLEISVADLFAGLPDIGQAWNDQEYAERMALAATRDGGLLLDAFFRLPSQFRKAMLSVVIELAQGRDGVSGATRPRRADADATINRSADHRR